MRKLGGLIVLFLITLVSMSFSAIPVMSQFQPQPEPPGDVILEKTMELQMLVEEADSDLFRGVAVTNTEKLRSALLSKIDEVAEKFAMEDWYGGYHKLNKDVAPKLSFPPDPIKPAEFKSWLNPEYPDVLPFVELCQGIIAEINGRLMGTGGVVAFVPRVFPSWVQTTISYIFRNFEPTTVTVSEIHVLYYRYGDFCFQENYAEGVSGWITGIVPPSQVVEICSVTRYMPGSGNWELHAFFHTSAGTFPAIGKCRVSL